MLVKTKSFKLAINMEGDVSSKRIALVLPGKLDTKDYAHMVSHVKFLSEQGFLAISFDPPGTWESPGNISLYNTTNYLKAIDELIDINGNKPTFVIGHSRGGSMAMLAGLSNPNIFAFASIMSFIYDLKEKNEKDWEKRGYWLSSRDLPPGGGPKIKEFKLPYSFHEDQLKYGMEDRLRESKKPKLFILGKKDQLVLPEIVRNIYKISSEPKKLYELDSPHDYRLYPDKIKEVNNVIKKFLEFV